MCFPRFTTHLVVGDQVLVVEREFGREGDERVLHPPFGWLVLGFHMIWTYRFHRDEKAWAQDPRVFVDMGRPMTDGSLALLKTRKHLRREKAEAFWKNLLSFGWEKVPPVWGPDAEP